MTDSQTPQDLSLSAWHQEHGAHLVNFAGCRLPLHYGQGILHEAEQCRSSASFFDVSHMGQFILEGANLDSFVSLLCPADVGKLSHGTMCYTMLLNDKGGILDDVIITKTEQGYRFVVNASRKAFHQKHFAKYSRQEMVIKLDEDRILLALQGPQSPVVLQDVLTSRSLQEFANRIPELTFMQSMTIETQDGEVWVSRCGYTGEDGFELSIPCLCGKDWIEALDSHPQASPAGLGARDVLRLEAGLPLYGQDIDENKTPVEAGLSWVISKSQRLDPQFLGSETILAMLEQPPPVRLRGIRFEGRQPVRTGCNIFLANSQSPDDENVGVITSGGYSKTEGAISLGYLKRELKPGDEIVARQRGRSFPGIITKLPFTPHRTVRSVPTTS